MQIKKYLGLVLYYSIARYLPMSSNRFLGKTSRRVRSFCAHMILDQCGKHVNIERNAIFSRHCILGNYSGIGVNANLTGRVRIGNHVMMGPDVTIYTRNHRYDRLDVPMCEQGFTEECAVEIGNDVWIGGQVIILPGRIIGSGAVVGSGSVVTNNVDPYTIVGGNPAVVIGYRKQVNRECGLEF